MGNRRGFPTLAVVGAVVGVAVVIASVVLSMLPRPETSTAPPVSTERPRGEVSSRPPQEDRTSPRPRPEHSDDPDTEAPETTDEPDTEEPDTPETSASPDQRPSPTRTKKPKRPEVSLPPPKTAGRSTLVDNPLYDVEVGEWSCPAMSDPVDSADADFPDYAEDAFDCMADRWTGILDTAGLKNDQVGLVWYSGRVQTPCAGYYPNGGFYCSANDTLYLDRGRLSDRDDHIRLGTLEMLFHEYGHHIQYRAGILPVAHDGKTVDESDELISRRIELQNNCFMWMHLGLATSGWSAQDEQEFRDWAAEDDDASHGSGRAKTYWFKQGYGHTDLGRCNTWTAGRNKVT
ncbi:neutral zinc metallopeptidase [Propionibacteriaceae bacterium Y1685]|uniref:neutral zinc metallopeptidase n=1 Tax=Microlunatus sp. Y1700 TaxID=3418487 RepID=UPI003B791DC6